MGKVQEEPGDETGLAASACAIVTVGHHFVEVRHEHVELFAARELNLDLDVGAVHKHAFGPRDVVDVGAGVEARDEVLEVWGAVVVEVTGQVEDREDDRGESVFVVHGLVERDHSRLGLEGAPWFALKGRVVGHDLRGHHAVGWLFCAR